MVRGQAQKHAATEHPAQNQPASERRIAINERMGIETARLDKSRALGRSAIRIERRKARMPTNRLPSWKKNWNLESTKYTYAVTVAGVSRKRIPPRRKDGTTSNVSVERRAAAPTRQLLLYRKR